MRVRIFLALVLRLTALSGARACRGPRARLAGAAAAGGRRSPSAGHRLHAHHGDTVHIFCSGTDSKHLSIKLEGIYPKDTSPGEQLMTVSNTTTLQLTLEEPVIAKYHYICSDVTTGCETFLEVVVWPTITINSRNIHQILIDEYALYSVPVGEEYEVTCSGKSELIITDGNDNIIQTMNVNETTIKSVKLREEKYLGEEYRCYFGVLYAKLIVYVDYHPAAIDFWCVKDGSRIDCSWSVMSTDTVFTLFYTGRNGNSMLGREKTTHCEWNIKEIKARGFELKDNFTLVMQACNLFYCQNQTFSMNIDSIEKPMSPRNLKLLKGGSYGATLSWKEHSLKIPIMYKVTYRLPGTPPQLLDESTLLVACKNTQLSFLQYYNKICRAKLWLSCPGTFYVIEVYARLTSTPPANDAYWSKPAPITFWTKPQNGTDAVDPACVKEPELIDNPYVGVSEVKRLARSVYKEGLALHRKLKSMEHTIYKIKKICQELALDDCEHFVLRDDL